jgi:hypothetical protein
MSNMLRYLTFLLLSHCTGLSISNVLELFPQNGASLPSLERTRFISTNILAFSASGRGQKGQSSWNCSSDQTQLLGEFEKASFRTGCRIFITPNHTYATLYDDLYGTRATDNQVKTLSARKAD